LQVAYQTAGQPRQLADWPAFSRRTPFLPRRRSEVQFRNCYGSGARDDDAPTTAVAGYGSRRMLQTARSRRSSEVHPPWPLYLIHRRRPFPSRAMGTTKLTSPRRAAGRFTKPTTRGKDRRARGVGPPSASHLLRWHLLGGRSCGQRGGFAGGPDDVRKRLECAERWRDVVSFAAEWSQPGARKGCTWQDLLDSYGSDVHIRISIFQ
jgi:hypothetical protein